MLIDFVNGQTGVILRVKIRNSSVSTGAGLAGLTSASAGLQICAAADNEATSTHYTVAGSTIESITTLGTFATPTATKCRFKEFDPTYHPGIYEIQLDNARFAVASAKSLLVSINGATNAAECDVVVPLRSVNPYSAASFMTGVNGLAPPANWNLRSIDSSGRGTSNVTQWGGNNVVSTNVNGVPVVDIGYVAGAVASPDLTNLVGTGHVTSVTSNGNFAIVFDAPYAGNLAALTDGTLWLSWMTGLNQWHAQKITGGTLTSSTAASFTFLVPFSQTVAVNDKFAIVSN